MAIFNSSCVENGNGVTVFSVPDVEPPSPSGSTFLDPELVIRNKANDRRGFLHANTSLTRSGVARELQASCAGTHGDLFWFEHLHITPENVALGNVLTTQERSYSYFNGYRYETKFINSITRAGNEGFTFTNEMGEDLVRSPLFLKPKETITVTVNVAPVGPVAINSSVTYTFATGEVLLITFTGQRVIIMSVEPQRNITQQYNFKTDIIESASGNEQRISVVDQPRETITYRFAKEDGDMAFLENLIWSWQGRNWALPIWNDFTELTSDVVVGALTIPVTDTTGRDLRADLTGGELAIIWSGPDSFEAFEVASFTDTTITSLAPLVNSHSDGAIVMPLRTARMFKPTGEQWSNVNFKQVQADWKILDARDWSADISPSPLFDGGVYRDLPVWDIYADYLVTNGSYTVSMNADLRDFNAPGKFINHTPKKFPRQQLNGLSMNSFGREGFNRLRQFMFALRGRQKTFWISSGRSDFVVESTTVAGSSTLNVEPVNYTNQIFNGAYGPQTRQDIQIRYNDGTVQYKRIINSVLTAGVREALTVDSTLSQDSDNIEKISYLIKRRLTNDELIFDHEFYEGETDISLGMIDVLE